GLAAHVEAGVDDDGDAGALVELPDHVVVARAGGAVHGLDARRVVEVGDGGGGGGGGPGRGREQHVGGGGGGGGPRAGPLPQHRRRERAEALAELDLEVDLVAVLGMAGVAEDAAVAERARAELHALLEPADHALVDDGGGGLARELGLAQAAVGDGVV